MQRATSVIDPSHLSKRISYAQILAKVQETDSQIQDELGKAQKELNTLKGRISEQSKENFVLERDVRYLDQRIALLIQNRMQLDEPLTSKDNQDKDDDKSHEPHLPEEKKMQLYSNLFFILQTEPRHIATLSRVVTMSDIDTLLQTVMFTLYGNQYDSREEHLLLFMFQFVLAHQFETCSDFGNLLRANTPLSRMMTTYTRRGPGQAYLKDLLTDLVASVIKHKALNLEINPLKVHEQLRESIREGSCGNAVPSCAEARVQTIEQAMAVPEVQQIIVPRISMLRTFADSFLSTIIGSLDRVPYGIRWICKQIKGFAKRKFPEASDWAICSLIGCFFMLRFTNPAIVTPQAYMLVPEQPGDHPRRTLTLIAKMLQNLSNKPMHQKETFMASLNDWADENKDRIKHFYWELCEVGDFYDSLELDQYIALSKKDLKISITLNEVFNMHALLERHRNVTAPADEAQMRQLLDALVQTGVPRQLPRHLNRKLKLPLYSKWEMRIQEPADFLQQSASGGASEEVQQSADLQYLEAKSIFVSLLRRILNVSVTDLDIIQLLDRAARWKDEDVRRKVKRATELLGHLSRAGFVTPENRYRGLANDVRKELIHLGDINKSVKREIESLRGVLSAIEEHNEYLRSQLDAYRDYLQNVRQQSARGGPSRSHRQSGAHTLLQQQQQQHGNANQHHHSHNKSDRKMRSLGSGGLSVPTRGHHTQQKPQVVRQNFSHAALEREGVIAETRIPEARRSNVFFSISSPTPGSFLVSLEYKGRDRPILEMDLRLDDLLEKQQDQLHMLDLEYVQFNVPKFIHLLNWHFIKR